MEPTTVAQPAPESAPAPQPIQEPTSPANFRAKQPPKLLYIFGGVAVILFSIALAIVFFGNKGTTPSTISDSSSENQTSVAGDDWPKYTNIPFFYELAIPPKWAEIRHSPLNQEFALFNADDTATLEITAEKSTLSLDEYLSSKDEQNKSTLKSTHSSQVKVGNYDGFERNESWPTVGLQGITTYTKISDMIYVFSLIPGNGKNAITNESIIRDYRGALSSFRLTDTTKLGLDLKDYASQQVSGLAFKPFALKYPQTWVLTEKKGENNLEVSIYRNNYELTISQKAVGGAVCLFSDSPSFEGSSGDLRNKQFAELTTDGNMTLRRYFNANAGDKSTMFFCEKQQDGPYYQTPLTVGGLVYNVPAKYDVDIIKEMDDIVKSLTLSLPSASPSAQTP